MVRTRGALQSGVQRSCVLSVKRVCCRRRADGPHAVASAHLQLYSCTAVETRESFFGKLILIQLYLETGPTTTVDSYYSCITLYNQYKQQL